MYRQFLYLVLKMTASKCQRKKKGNMTKQTDTHASINCVVAETWKKKKNKKKKTKQKRSNPIK